MLNLFTNWNVYVQWRIRVLFFICFFIFFTKKKNNPIWKWLQYHLHQFQRLVLKNSYTVDCDSWWIGKISRYSLWAMSPAKQKQNTEQKNSTQKTTLISIHPSIHWNDKASMSKSMEFNFIFNMKLRCEWQNVNFVRIHC